MKKINKVMALMLALTLLVGAAIGGTIAWLIDSTDEVKNTFTTSDINIELKEHTYDPDTDSLTNNETTTGVDNYKMIPGWTIPKDPWVTVKTGSEACWLFVKVSENGGVVTYTQDGETKETTWDDFLTYTIATNDVAADTVWTKLTDAGTLKKGETVYYIAVDALTADDAEDMRYHILKDDQVKVNEDVTKEMMNALKNEPTKYPTLTFKAYAIQKADTNADGVTTWTAAEAWKKTPDYVALPPNPL